MEKFLELTAQVRDTPRRNIIREIEVPLIYELSTAIIILNHPFCKVLIGNGYSSHVREKLQVCPEHANPYNSPGMIVKCDKMSLIKYPCAKNIKPSHQISQWFLNSNYQSNSTYPKGRPYSLEIHPDIGENSQNGYIWQGPCLQSPLSVFLFFLYIHQSQPQ